MSSVGLLPAVSILAGAVCGVFAPGVWLLKPVLAPLAVAAWIAHWRGHRHLLISVLAVGFYTASAVLTADAREQALGTPLRAALDREYGGFAIESTQPSPRHDPIPARVMLLEDASREAEGVTLRAVVVAIRPGGVWQKTAGGVTLSVNGAMAGPLVDEWRAGRILETSIAFRVPTRYLNEGVPDFERALALDGTTLFGSVKSGLLIDVQHRGTIAQETGARVRQHVRRSVERWVGPHDATSGAIVTAVVIGDRAGLPDDVRLRLQAAGTYHVFAISGGNIAILAGLTLGFLLVFGVTGRPAAVVTIVLLTGYAQVVSGGASVWRATLMAALYLGARLLDHRCPPWQAIAMTAALVICARPLVVRDAGFMLTFGATAALLDIARRAAFTAPRGGAASRRSLARTAAWWVMASLAASAAGEVALLPLNAWTFSRVTSAGLVLNLVAVPLMGMVQVGGMVVAGFDRLDVIARPAGWIAHAAARALVDSARLVDLAPWLAMRVPPPSLLVVSTYYGSLAATLAAPRRFRAAGVLLLVVSAAAIVTGQPSGWLRTLQDRGGLRLSFFDVGQGDATLVQFPQGSTLLVDAGGIPFGGGSFDMGSRVLAPALWARGIRGLDTLLLTHGDPDHIGGARAIVADFEPGDVWEGIPVPRHAPLQEVLNAAQRAGARVDRRRDGEELWKGAVRVRVLHPQPPDWERRRVRNDDSVVTELLYGDVAVLLTGDISADVEKAILPQLPRAPIRILKVAHHGSRTSSSPELLEQWRPQIAVISCGRGNTFGHPAPEVLRRLEAIGATVYRTSLHGQVTVETNGREVRVRTYVRH